MDFTKPATTHEQQIRLLESRGLTVEDEARAKHYLRHINYYRLAGYWLPLEADHASHRFQRGATFDDVLDLYNFDREFRLHLLDAIERVEVSLRAQWAHHMAHAHGPHAHLDARHAANLKLHARHLAKLEEEVARSEEVFIQHYQRTYHRPASPPVWAVSEIMSFGMLSRWITQMVPSDRAVVARTYNLDQRVLKGFVRHLTYIRNLCAHHSRVWNRRLTVTMPLPKSKPPGLNRNMTTQSTRNIYNSLVMLVYLMSIISPGSQWKNRLLELLEVYRVDTQKMGFPVDWRALPVWTDEST
ncbi:Abi family protein [Marinimicrobium sp. LS-A18]|uniref:Abi family protein n=1 Tax=Marinimicrobium sp. LS-A18 TaxID=1381596 RepID=UPI00046787EB|nr:Abi family protein [Marinimicrobium sp. LS-A18]